jgi:hypothetical protein
LVKGVVDGVVVAVMTFAVEGSRARRTGRVSFFVYRGHLETFRRVIDRVLVWLHAEILDEATRDEVNVKPLVHDDVATTKTPVLFLTQTAIGTFDSFHVTNFSPAPHFFFFFTMTGDFTVFVFAWMQTDADVPAALTDVWRKNCDRKSASIARARIELKRRDMEMEGRAIHGG